MLRMQFGIGQVYLEIWEGNKTLTIAKEFNIVAIQKKIKTYSFIHCKGT
jgi:hypothetical protein